MTTPPSPSTVHARPAVIISDLSDYADDNVAILMLLRSDKFDVRAIITTSGNVCAERSSKEGRRFLDAAGAHNIPIIQGFPLKWHESRIRYYDSVERPSRSPTAFAGALDTQPECVAQANRDAAITPDPAALLIEQARATAGGLTIILIGPATILAEAIRRDAAIAIDIRQVLAMGGAFKVPGNATQYSEFNVWFDPEAMSTLLASDIPLTLVPLDATNSVTYATGPRLPGTADPGFASTYLASYLERRRSGRTALLMWDEVLAAVAIDPTLIEATEDLALSVSTEKDAYYGMTLSLQGKSAAATRPVHVVSRVNADGVRRLVERLIPSGE